MASNHLPIDAVLAALQENSRKVANYLALTQQQGGSLDRASPIAPMAPIAPLIIDHRADREPASQQDLDRMQSDLSEDGKKESSQEGTSFQGTASGGQWRREAAGEEGVIMLFSVYSHR